MLKIITLNLNGIRSAGRKGFFTWLQSEKADIICVQELKAQQDDLRELQHGLENYHHHYHYAAKKGYSGVAIFSRFKPKNILTGLGFPVADDEGRHVAIDLDGLIVSSLYLPSGTSGEERQTIKFQFLERYSHYLQNLSKNSDYIICGDFNIAHKEIDLKNWRANRKNSGFLPEERVWLDQLFTEQGFSDAFRLVNQAPEQYTWWSNRGRAYEKNVGWRIDYQVVSPNIVKHVKNALIYKDQRFSDHAPLILNYDMVV